jgi:hypothetical protein
MTWEHADAAKMHITAIHFAHTTGQRDLLMCEVGKIWDKWGGDVMNTFWNSYCVAPWKNWSVGLFDCVLCTPSQQAQERYHRDIFETKIPGMFKGSTKTVINESLPRLIEHDAITKPTTLTFAVPAVPKLMITKALWYVDHKSTHTWWIDFGKDKTGFYFLSKSNSGGFPKITLALINKYEGTLDGEFDRRSIKDIEGLIDVCQCLYTVQDGNDKYPVPECHLNPLGLDCIYCPCFKGYGICSHVLAANHMMKAVNLRRLTVEIGRKASKKPGGNYMRPGPALKRTVYERDSSDEEADRLIGMGAAGR